MASRGNVHAERESEDDGVRRTVDATEQNIHTKKTSRIERHMIPFVIFKIKLRTNDAS